MIDTILTIGALFSLGSTMVIATVLGVYHYRKYKAKKMYEHIDPLLCCCGDTRRHHGYSSNHSFVSAKEYYTEQALKKVKVFGLV